MRPVLWGIGLQFIFGILILRTSWGHTLFHWVGQRIVMFLDFTNEGARFVFGEQYEEHFFAFKVSRFKRQLFFNSRIGYSVKCVKFVSLCAV